MEFDGEDDHVHLLVSCPPKVSASPLVSNLRVSLACVDRLYLGHDRQPRGRYPRSQVEALRLVENERKGMLRVSPTRTSRFKIPRYVISVDTLPMTASGKVQRVILRDRAKEEVAGGQ